MHQDKISKDVEGNPSAFSTGMERRGTHKGREADDGQAPKGVELIFRLRDRAKYSCQTGNGEGERAIKDSGQDAAGALSHSRT